MTEGKRPLIARGKSQKEIRAYNFQEQVGFLLRKAYQSHALLFQRLCPDKQLTTAQFAVLCALRDGGACSLSDIGRAVVMDPATTRGIVARLSERGMVALKSDVVDKRRMVVGLTKKGRTQINKIIPHAINISEATFSPLNPAERAALVYLLRKLPNAAILDEEIEKKDDIANGNFTAARAKRGS